MAEPRFAVYVRSWHPPLTGLETVPGEWRWEEGWPIERIRMRTLYPAPTGASAMLSRRGQRGHKPSITCPPVAQRQAPGHVVG